MGTFSNIKERKTFSGDIKDVVLFCAQRINAMKTWKVDEFNEEEGYIISIFLGAVQVSSASITKEMTYSITLAFNSTPFGTECIGTISNPMMEGNLIAKIMAKKMLKKFLESL